MVRPHYLRDGTQGLSLACYPNRLEESRSDMKVFLVGTREDKSQYEVDPKVEIGPRMTLAEFERIGRTITVMLQRDCVVVHAQKA